MDNIETLEFGCSAERMLRRTITAPQTLSRLMHLHYLALEPDLLEMLDLFAAMSTEKRARVHDYLQRLQDIEVEPGVSLYGDDFGLLSCA